MPGLSGGNAALIVELEILGCRKSGYGSKYRGLSFQLGDKCRDGGFRCLGRVGDVIGWIVIARPGRTVESDAAHSRSWTLISARLPTVALLRTRCATYENRTHTRLDRHCRWTRGNPRHGLVGHFPQTAFNIPSPNYCFVGRWLRYMPEGIFRHSRIAAAPQKSSECTVGWIAH